MTISSFPTLNISLRMIAASVVSCLLGGLHPASAQTPGVAGQLPPSSGPTSLAVNDGSLIKVNFPNTPVQAIIPFYTQLTGKRMILDSSLQGEALRIIAPQPLSKKAAIGFIEATLLLNGYSIIQVDSETVKLIHHTGGKDPASEGLPVFSSIKDLPEGEQIVHFVMPLQHVSPEEASKAFQQVIKLHTYGAITPVTNAAALIIRENSATIRSIFEIAQIIDVPPAEIANEMIKLERSDAESIAEILNEIYEEKEKSASAPQAQQAAANTPANPAARGPAPSGGNNGGTTTSDTNPTSAKVKVIPYRRTNHLLVIARPVDIAYIRGIVEKLDQQEDDSNRIKIKLKYMPVTDFLAVAYKALAKDTDIQNDEGGGPSGGGSSPRLSGSSSTPSTQASRSSQRDPQSSFNSPFGGTGTGTSGSSGSNSGASRSVLDDPERSGTPESVVVGRTLLIADPHSNNLIVSGSPEHITVIKNLVAEMDLRPQQIYISTVIGQLALGDEYEYGFDFLKLLDNFTLRRVREVNVSSTSTSTVNNPDGTASSTTTTGTTTATAVGGVGTGTALTGANGETAAAGTNVVNTGSGNVINATTQTVADAAGLLEIPLNFSGFNWSQLNLYGQMASLGQYLRVMDQDKHFKVLSRPSIYARNNTKAVISSGQRIAVPTNILSNGGVGAGIASTSASIDYRDVVLKLEVIPLINSDDEVTLKISQLNDNITGSQTISGNTIPTIGTQELNTEITVKSGQTVVLGGLITEKVGDNGRGVILLRRIPIIKHLFGVTQKSISREELLIFIQPQIIKQSDPLDKPNEFEIGRSRVLEETLRFSGPDRPVRKATLAE